jgi:hypothetical protein
MEHPDAGGKWSSKLQSVPVQMYSAEILMMGRKAARNM